MNRTVKVLTAVLLTVCWFSQLDAQEVITPLFGKISTTGHTRNKGRQSHSSEDILLELPFMDDFSQPAGIPDPSLWSDNHVLINNNYCIDPVTYGVATLDALDFDGSLYPTAVSEPFTYISDHLTSHPINMDYPVSDSIYFSFLYQAGGLGIMPDEKDSLLVDFFDPVSDIWINVWGIPGKSDLSFHHVMIPVRDERFLTSGFRFRFKNRVSLLGSDDFPGKLSNEDHWNVDYVRLAGNRFAADTILRDAAFTAHPTSMLKNFTSLPWAHFNQAKNTVFQSPISVRYRNNDSITRNITRYMIVQDLVYNEEVFVGDSTAQDLEAMEDTIVDNDFFYPFDSDRGDSAVIRFMASLRTDEFDPKTNDTIYYDQVFKDYYSYDDGSAEAGYGLRGQGSQNGRVAIRFNSYVPDLLGGVDIYFNHVLDSANLGYFFKLMVWDDEDGMPGSVIHEDENDLVPEYSSSLQGFRRYMFSTPVAVDGPFHIGFLQYNKYLLNVGLDLNNQPAPIVTHYNLGGGWSPTEIPGVILFRPVLYDETAGKEKTVKLGQLTIYPNPATNHIHINTPEPGSGSEIFIEIFDATGRLVNSSTIRSGSYNVSSIPNGIYFIRARTGRMLYSSKLLINR